MQISIVVAMANNNVIGLNNKMPWHLPAELQYFKKITMGKPIIMGRKTFESIGKALPGRKNIVVTHQVDYQGEAIIVVNSLEEALQAVNNEAEVMIIGGATIYQQAIQLANRLYITKINIDCEGDTFFPTWDEKAWQVIQEDKHLADDKNPHDFTTLILDRAKWI